MSDTYISLVPDKTGSRKEEIHKKVLSFLLDKNIITNDLQPGDNVDAAIVENNGNFKTINPNSLEIAILRQVFHSGGNDIEQVLCPSCNKDISNKTDWTEAVDQWYADSSEHKIVCPNCSDINAIQNHIFNPTWAFGDLGFTFWNYPDFRDSFIKEISELTNTKFKIVYGRL